MMVSRKKKWPSQVFLALVSGSHLEPTFMQQTWVPANTGVRGVPTFLVLVPVCVYIIIIGGPMGMLVCFKQSIWFIQHVLASQRH